MVNNRNIIECCNNTYRGRHVPADKCALALLTSVTLVMLVVGSMRDIGVVLCNLLCHADLFESN